MHTHTYAPHTYTHASLHITHSHILQSEHIGFSMYDLILDEDYDEVKAAIAKAETSAMARLSSKGTCIPRLNYSFPAHS